MLTHRSILINTDFHKCIRLKKKKAAVNACRLLRLAQLDLFESQQGLL